MGPGRDSPAVNPGAGALGGPPGIPAERAWFLRIRTQRRLACAGPDGLRARGGFGFGQLR
jgi:hypothetical protein